MCRSPFFEVSACPTPFGDAKRTAVRFHSRSGFEAARQSARRLDRVITRRCCWRIWPEDSDRQVAAQLGHVSGDLHVVLRFTVDNMPPQQLRAVVGARVSHLDDDKETTRKVSHLAQTEEGERWAQAQGYAVVGRFEDLGISASQSTEPTALAALWPQR
jgi:hypothetical protein